MKKKMNLVNATKKSGIGKAHSKIILMGEHSVVYGHPAIALPLKNIEVTCEITPAKKPLQFNSESPLATAIFASLKYLEIENHPISYRIESRVPKRRGMGSSAAVSIAAIRAVFDYFEEDLDKDTLEMLANQAEIIAHTNPSGLDAKTCLSDTAIKFIRNVGFSEFKLDLAAFLVIADTGIHGHTREAVEKVEQQEEKALSLLHQLGHYTRQAEQAIFDKNRQTLGRLMSDSHKTLVQLGVSCPESDHLVAVSLAHGALGAKMSGGGLGGCIIALVATEEKANQIATKLREEGAVKTWIENLSL